MSLIIKSNGETINCTPENGVSFRLPELQNTVNGYIEIVTLLNGKKMVINEEGRLKGLPHNEAATKLFGADIVGDVLVCNSELID